MGDVPFYPTLDNILDEPFPPEPPEHVGVCRHGVGIVIRGGLNCTMCGYFVRAEAQGREDA